MAAVASGTAVWMSLVSISGLELLPVPTSRSAGVTVEGFSRPSLASIIPLLLVASWPILVRRVYRLSAGVGKGVVLAISRLAIYSCVLSSALLSYSIVSQIAGTAWLAGDAAALGLALLGLHITLTSLSITANTPSPATVILPIITLVTLTVSATMLSIGLYALIPLTFSIYAALSFAPQILSLTAAWLRLKQDLERPSV
ncbi:MAG: hypothetical protein F7C09_03020 [Aeropyrum sp.]|nr:hypothetical protein [Aeropyrum sp.]